MKSENEKRKIVLDEPHKFLIIILSGFVTGVSLFLSSVNLGWALTCFCFSGGNFQPPLFLDHSKFFNNYIVFYHCWTGAVKILTKMIQMVGNPICKQSRAESNAGWRCVRRAEQKENYVRLVFGNER